MPCHLSTLRMAGHSFVQYLFLIFHAEISVFCCCIAPRLAFVSISLPKCWHESSVSLARADMSGTIFSAQPTLSKGLLQGFSVAFVGIAGQMAIEVFLAPNLLSLCGCQSLCWLYIAKASSPDIWIRRVHSSSGQPGSRQLYLPKCPDGCSENSNILHTSSITQISNTHAQQSNAHLAHTHKFLVVFLPKLSKFIPSI